MRCREDKTTDDKTSEISTADDRGIQRRFTSGHDRDTIYPHSMIASDKITYLDNNATTAIDPAVLETMRPFLEKYFAR